MNIELDWEQKSLVVICVLREEIQLFEQMIQDNYEYHNCKTTSFAPLYSWDYKIENKKLKKMLKSIIRLHNYYSLEKYESEV